MFKVRLNHQLCFARTSNSKKPFKNLSHFSPKVFFGKSGGKTKWKLVKPGSPGKRSLHGGLLIMWTSIHRSVFHVWTFNYECESHTHNHFTALFPGLPGWAGGRRSLLLEFVMQGKITEADTPTIRLGATPSGLITEPPPSSPPIFTPDTLPAATLPLYPGLGQASNMLACIPSCVIQLWMWIPRWNVESNKVSYSYTTLLSLPLSSLCFSCSHGGCYTERNTWPTVAAKFTKVPHICHFWQRKQKRKIALVVHSCL